MEKFGKIDAFLGLVILLLLRVQSLLLRSRPFLPSRSLLSLFHTFSLFFPRAPTKDSRLFYRRIFSSSGFAGTFPSRISPPPRQSDFFLLVAAAVATATTAFQSIRVGRKRKREKDKERGRKRVQSTKVAPFDYTRAIVYDSARESNRNSLLFALPYCSYLRIALPRYVSYSATNCHPDGQTLNERGMK